MTAAEILAGGGIVLAAMTLIQIAPIKLDPWSAIARAVGRAINKDVIDKLDETRDPGHTHKNGWSKDGGRAPGQDPAIQQ